MTKRAAGNVSLVGAGPGDPALITVAGLQRLREADVIVYDRLVNDRLLKEARAEAELIYMGKVAGEGAHDQQAINRLLIEKAREGKRVVRLKGGDPFVFGRGGEEALALRQAGIDFEIVPGVTSAVAVPAYAGIPVTHRGLASSFTVITAHEAEAAEDSFNSQLSTFNSADTLVFLMGIKTLPEVIEKLIAAGRSPKTPAAVIRWGTTPEQRTVVGTLADIAQRAIDGGIMPPAITVVGEVVRLRETLSWFEGRPLFGKRVLITRTRRQASVLARLLSEAGAIPIELPAIEIEPAGNAAQIAEAIERLTAGEYAWAVFTSANGVEEWFRHLAGHGLDARAFGKTRLAAIGPATAEALAAHGIRADLVPDEYIAEAIIEALAPVILSSTTAGNRRSAPWRRNPAEEGKRTTSANADQRPRILIPRAEDARPELIEGLRAAGADVDEVILYRAATPADAPKEALEMLRRGEIDIVTFTSSSTVRSLAAILNGDVAALNGSLIACIGPVTARTAEELGLRVDVVAPEHTAQGLVGAIREASE